MIHARSVYLLLVILVSAIAERSFDYDVDDLDQVESFIWDSSDAPHMGPTRPGPPNPAPAENLIGSLPPLPPYQKPAWRPAVPVFPIPHQSQQPHGNQAHPKNPPHTACREDLVQHIHIAPGATSQARPSHPSASMEVCSSSSSASGPAVHRSADHATPNPASQTGLSLPLRSAAKAQHAWTCQPQGDNTCCRRRPASRRCPKNLPADDVYYASQSNKLPRKVVKQGVFQPKRKPQVSQSITVVEQGKNGEWFKVPVDKVATGLGRRNYEVVELHKADDVRKVGPGLNNGEESIHYIHIQES
ncbi:hypothetical protein MTO96_045352 [Rhipicephalus appendiculatus]